MIIKRLGYEDWVFYVELLVGLRKAHIQRVVSTKKLRKYILVAFPKE